MLVIRQVLLSEVPVDVLGEDVDVSRPYRLSVSAITLTGTPEVFLGGPDVNTTSWPDDASWDDPEFVYSALPLGAWGGSGGIHLDGVRLFAVCKPIEDQNIYLRVFAYGE